MQNDLLCINLWYNHFRGGFMYIVKVCPYCHKNNKKTWIYSSGFDVDADKLNRTKCVVCGRELVNTVLTVEEYSILEKITIEVSFFDSMMDLKQKDPIEFQLKMSQFKTQLQQQKGNEQIENSNLIHCPKCDSTAITTGARGVNNFWGLLGASKTVNRCGNCGYTWKPNNW